MKYSILPHIVSVILLMFSLNLYSQKRRLILKSSDKKSIKILNNLNFNKFHEDSLSVNIELKKISSFLKKEGYFIHTIDSTVYGGKNIDVYFSLKEKTDHCIIKVNFKDLKYVNSLYLKKEKLYIPTKELEENLKKISETLDNDGRSFSKVQLQNIIIVDNILYADLQVYASKKRNFDKVIVRGYDNFPKSFIKNYFNIDDLTKINKNKLNTISKLSKNLKFANEIKKPEILFTNDSTLLYLYLKRKKNSSFDGIINFASKENGGLLINGNVDLNFNNILNTGETFNIFWNSIGNERQELNILTKIPFLFNTKFSPEISFLIYKQDSTFLNTKFDAKLFYNLNSKTSFALTYNRESSEKTIDSNLDDIDTFNNYFLGLSLRYHIPKNDVFFNNKFAFEINPLFGVRTSTSSKSNQFKLNANISYIFDISRRSSLFLKNETGYLSSNSYFDNELFRIGGAQSIRGFNEQSIFAKNYSLINIEYRMLTSNSSYLYTITDLATVKNNLSNSLISLGMGYTFIKSETRINIGASVGKLNSTSFNTSDVKIIINYLTYF